jgi:galacturan 1,4-alpha-galacturonidase
VINVFVEDANILTYNQDMETAAYIKNLGWEISCPSPPATKATSNPTAAAGPYPHSSHYTIHLLTISNRGVVQNIRFENFFIQGSNIGPEITQDSGNNGSYSGASLMGISNIAFVNFTGYATGGKGTRRRASAARQPTLATTSRAANRALYPPQGTCTYIAPGGVSGMNGPGCI